MIRAGRKPLVRDPQAGVAFRPWMLAHGGSIIELAAHRVGAVEDSDGPRRSTFLPWTMAMAGLMAAFFLGTSWSGPPPPAGTACLVTAPAPAAAPSKNASLPELR